MRANGDGYYRRSGRSATNNGRLTAVGSAKRALCSSLESLRKTRTNITRRVTYMSQGGSSAYCVGSRGMRAHHLLAAVMRGGFPPHRHASRLCCSGVLIVVDNLDLPPSFLHHAAHESPPSV